MDIEKLRRQADSWLHITHILDKAEPGWWKGPTSKTIEELVTEKVQKLAEKAWMYDQLDR